MEKNIEGFIYDSNFSRNKLTSKIYGLVGYKYSVGLHAIGFTKKNKKEVATSIVQEGLRITNNLSIYSTVKFFNVTGGNNDELDKYTYDQTNPNEVVLIVAIPKKFEHSSGQTVEAGSFQEMTVLDAKLLTNEFSRAANEADRVFKPVPSEMILGCYTFNRKDIRYESATISNSIILPDGRVEVNYAIDPYHKAILGPCDFYINPGHYSQLSQEEKDAFIEKFFGHKIKKPEEKPKFYVKRRTFPKINN